MFTVTGESLVSLVSPLLLDTLVSHTPVDALQHVNEELSELMSDPIIDAPGTSDTFSAVTSLLSGDFGAVVPKVRSASISKYTQIYNDHSDYWKLGINR